MSQATRLEHKTGKEKPMRWRYGPPLVVGVVWAAALVITGCVGLMEPRSGVAKTSVPWSNPLAQTGSAFYPLEVGNHWEYENEFRFQIVPVEGAAGDPSVDRSTRDVDLIGTEQRFGREYVVQRETDGSFESRFLYRQDKAGLYNADPESAPSARRSRTPDAGMLVARSLGGASETVRSAYRATMTLLLAKQEAMRRLALHGGALAGASIDASSSGPLEGEIAILRYPLAPSKTWHVREDPLVVYTVEGQEVLNLPAGSFTGWRIRIDWPGTFGPNDRARVWYGRDGLLQLDVHAEGVATDENGNTIGTIVSDQLERMSDLALVRNGS